jgi:hypothetical protein
MFIVAEMVGSFLGRHDAIAILRQTENGMDGVLRVIGGFLPRRTARSGYASAYSFSVGEDAAGGED